MAPKTGRAQGLLRALDQCLALREARIVRSALRTTTAFLLPVQCVSCGRPDERLCRSCAKGLRRSARQAIRVEEPAEALPLNAQGQPLPVMAAGKYEHELASVLLHYKNQQMVALGKILVPLLAAALRAAIQELADPSAPVILVPIPTRRQALAKRGYWPVGLLLHKVDRAHLLPANVRVAKVLRFSIRASWGKAQKSKGRKGRASVRNTMQTRDTPGARKVLNSAAQVLFVDDVLTTGATLAEAHRSLGEFDLRIRGAVVVAGTPPPNENRQLS